jgi:UvrB/uvrC motif
MELKVELSDAVALENFERAARCRDDLTALQLSARQQMELDCVHALRCGNDSQQHDSLRKLAQFPACEGTQQAIAECLHNEKLAVRSMLRVAQAACTIMLQR